MFTSTLDTQTNYYVKGKCQCYSIATHQRRFLGEPHLKGELVFLPVVEGDVLGHHLPQVVLHKLHGEAESLLDLIPGRSVVVVAG